MREWSHALYSCCYGRGGGEGEVRRRKLADSFELQISAENDSGNPYQRLHYGYER